MEAIVGVFAIFCLVVCLMLLCFVLLVHNAYVVVAYILEGKALSAIARRRGMDKPWLAWVPVGKFWLLGAISDQYRYVVHGQVRNRRKLLLWLDIVFVVCSAVFTAGLEIWSAAMIWSTVSQPLETWGTAFLGGVAVIYLVLFVYIAVAAVISVFQYQAYFDLFRSCHPGKSLMYLLVSIFTTYSLPFFVYSCRNKDLGMSPRKDTTAAEQNS